MDPKVLEDAMRAISRFQATALHPDMDKITHLHSQSASAQDMLRLLMEHVLRHGVRNNRSPAQLFTDAVDEYSDAAIHVSKVWTALQGLDAARDASASSGAINATNKPGNTNAARASPRNAPSSSVAPQSVSPAPPPPPSKVQNSTGPKVPNVMPSALKGASNAGADATGPKPAGNSIRDVPSNQTGGSCARRAARGACRRRKY